MTVDRGATIPAATVARLAIYLRVLAGRRAEDIVSSDTLARAAGVNAATLRRDLSHVGSAGVRGVGYRVAPLVEQLEQVLGLGRAHAVAVVGVGHLGQALAGYQGFAARGFGVAALFDVDPARVGTVVAGLEVAHVDDLAAVARDRGITLGVVATPAAVAQEVCDRLVAAGVRCILDFAPTRLTVGDDVELRTVDLAAEMQILSFHHHHLHTVDGVEAGVAGSGSDPEAVSPVRPAPSVRSGVTGPGAGQPPTRATAPAVGSVVPPAVAGPAVARPVRKVSR